MIYRNFFVRHYVAIYSILLCNFFYNSFLNATTYNTTTGTDLNKYLILTTPNLMLHNESMIGAIELRNNLVLSTTEASITLGLERIDGNIYFNNGMIQLAHDLHVGPNTKWKGPGFIAGNGHTIYLDGDLTIEPSPWDTNYSGLYWGNIVFTNSGPYSGTVTIDGQGNRLKVQGEIFDGLDFASNLNNVTFKNIIIENIDEGNLIIDDSYTNTFIVDNVTLNIKTNSFLSLYSAKIKGTVQANTYATQVPAGISFLGLQKKCSIDHMSQLYVGPSTVLFLTSNNPNETVLTFSNQSSRLFCDNSTIFLDPAPYVRNRHINFTKGTLLINGNVDLQSTPSANAFAPDIVFGNGILTDDMNIVILPGSTLSLGTTAYYKNVY